MMDLLVMASGAYVSVSFFVLGWTAKIKTDSKSEVLLKELFYILSS